MYREVRIFMGRVIVVCQLSTSAYIRKPNNNIEILSWPTIYKILKPYFIDVFIQGRLKVKHIEISVITQRRNGVAAMKRTHGCHNIKPLDSEKWDQGLSGPIQITVKWDTIISTERTARYIRRGTCMTK